MQWTYLALIATLATAHVQLRRGTRLALECVERDIEIGEHTEVNGSFAYRPFPKCAETGDSLTIGYMVDQQINCTISLTDELFHLLQLYVHLDAPWSCGFRGVDEAPVSMNLGGRVEKSHLDIRSSMNFLASYAPNARIEGAVAYSTGPLATAKRVVIGDPLTLQLRVRWLPTSLANLSGRVSYHRMFAAVTVSSVVSFTFATLFYHLLQRPWQLKRQLTHQLANLETFDTEKRD